MRRAVVISLLLHATALAWLATHREPVRTASAPGVTFQMSYAEASMVPYPRTPDLPLPEREPIKETFEIDEPALPDEIDERIPERMPLASRPAPIASVRIKERKPTAAPVGQPVAVSLPAHPRPDGCPPPRYPTLARRRGQEGVVRLRLSIDALGRVDAVTVLRTSGFPLLDRAALKAVRSWRFEPAREGGRPVAAELIQPVEFRLRRE